MAGAVAVAIGVMQLTRTVHPPAGADPLVVITTVASWKFLLMPVFAGSILLVVCALVFNNFQKERSYPKYWL
jgi:CBS-domain-containing membrane protein